MCLVFYEGESGYNVVCDTTPSPPLFPTGVAYITVNAAPKDSTWTLDLDKSKYWAEAKLDGNPWTIEGGPGGRSLTTNDINKTFVLSPDAYTVAADYYYKKIPPPTPEVTPEVTVEVTVEVTPEVTVEITPEVTVEVTPSPTPTATPMPTPRAGLELAPTATPTPTPTATPIPNQPPTASITGPDTAEAGYPITLSGTNSRDPDGSITTYTWSMPDAVTPLAGTSGYVTFKNKGSPYTAKVTLSVTDNNGAQSQPIEKSINVTIPKPTARMSVSGFPKENRAVTVSLETSTAAPLSPIDWTKTQLEITPSTGTGATNEIYIENQEAVSKYTTKRTITDNKFRMLCRDSGNYRVKVTIYSIHNMSNTTETTIAINEDLPPKADFSVPTVLYRESNNKALLTATENSVSDDGDSIQSTAFNLKFDSDNDGSFADETILQSMSSHTSSFNPLSSVGMYCLTLRAEETIPLNETIPAALAPNATKFAVCTKNIKVDNAPPVVTLSAVKRRMVDITVNAGMGQYDLTQIDNLVKSYIKPTMISENIDYSINITNGVHGTSNLPTTNPISWKTSTLTGRTRDIFFWLYNPDSPYAYKGKIVARHTSETPMGGHSINRGYTFTTLAESLTDMLFLRDNGTVWTCNNSLLESTSPYVSQIQGPTNVKEIALQYCWANSYGYAKEANGHIWWWRSPYVFVPGSATNSLPAIAGYIAPSIVKHAESIGGILPTVTWREGAEKYFIDINNCYRTEMDNTVTKIKLSNTIRSKGITYIGIGNSSNETQVKSLGEYIQNSSSALTATASYIVAKGKETPAVVKYILAGQTLDHTINYSDLESDPKAASNWAFTHNPDHFNNSLGIISDSGKDLSDPITTFAKTGEYNIKLKTQDIPTSDTRFDNYKKWSKETGMMLYVHRAPIAEYSFAVTLGQGSEYLPKITNTSYDLDHASREDRGITENLWQWKEADEVAWHDGLPSSLAKDKEYSFSLTVKDMEGVWSLPTITTFSTVSPPPPTITLTSPASEASYLVGATVPIAASGANCHHIALFINGTCIDVQNGNNYSLSKVFNSPGNYNIYAVARNTANSTDVGSQIATSNMVSITVSELSLSKFEITDITDRQWEDVFWTSEHSIRTGTTYPVSLMPVDKHPVKKIVAKKGYGFYFDITSKGFNGSSDIIILKPRFYYLKSLSNEDIKRTYEVDLYYDSSEEYLIKYGDPIRDKFNIQYTMPDGQKYSVGSLTTLTLKSNLRTKVDTETAKWFGLYGLPTYTKAVKKGNMIVKNQAVDYSEFLRGGYILVNFTIEGYKNGVKSFSYSPDKWKAEGGPKDNSLYYPGDTIIFDNMYSAVDDYGASTDR